MCLCGVGPFRQPGVPSRQSPPGGTHWSSSPRLARGRNKSRVVPSVNPGELTPWSHGSLCLHSIRCESTKPHVCLCPFSLTASSRTSRAASPRRRGDSPSAPPSKPGKSRGSSVNTRGRFCGHRQAGARPTSTGIVRRRVPLPRHTLHRQLAILPNNYSNSYLLLARLVLLLLAHHLGRVVGHCRSG
jgi:hypothetical protein